MSSGKVPLITVANAVVAEQYPNFTDIQLKITVFPAITITFDNTIQLACLRTCSKLEKIMIP